MKSKKGLWVILYSCLALAVAFGTFSWLKILHARAEGSVVTNNDIPEENASSGKGAEDNPFVILDIVPYEGYTEIGYLIEGCEPVDIEEMCRTGADMSTVRDMGGAGITDKMFTDEEGIPEDWVEKTGDITLWGYYERVGENKGFIKKNGSSYESVGENKGNLIWVTTGTEKSQLSKQVSDANLDAVGNRIYTSRKASGYYEGIGSTTARYKYVNYNNFLRNSLDVKTRKDIKDYHIVVKTIEPAGLNSNPDWIERADLINISPRSHITKGPEIWASYKKSGRRALSSPPADFAGANDLSWEAVRRIFEKVNINPDYAAIVMDSSVYNPGGAGAVKTELQYQMVNYDGKASGKYTAKVTGLKSYNNKVYRMALMMKVMDPRAFYNIYLRPNNGNTTGLIDAEGKFTIQRGDAQTYWNERTFLLTKPDGSASAEDDWKDLWDTDIKLDTNFSQNNLSVGGRLYVYNGDNSLNQIFLDSSKIALNKTSWDGKNYTEELRDYLHGASQTDPATAIKFILGTQGKARDYKPKLTILDVEPCNDYTMTEMYFRLTYVPTYLGDIEIIRQNSQEFNGKIEDLNAIYDLIYLGINDGDLNKDGSGKTKYNDPRLNGLIYTAIGDKMTSAYMGGKERSTGWIAGHGGDDELRLPGNDITKLRAGFLADYLKAGYPILAEKKLSNTTKVDSNTNIYQFVTHRTEASFIYADASDAVSRVAERVMLRKPLIELLDHPEYYNGEDSNNDGKIDAPNYIGGSKLTYIFKINDGVNDGKTEYGVRLYVDTNADGRFDKEGSGKDDSEIIIQETGLRANNNEIKVEKPLNSLIGSIPWKLEVYSVANENIRYSTIGLSAVKRRPEEKQKIRVLQINQNPSTSYPSKLDISDDISKDGKFKKYTQDLNDYKLEITTKSIQEFEGLFKDGNRFDPASAATKGSTDKLVKNYDMLIFGFADYYQNVVNTDGALDNVKYFIDCGKSVLFTHDVTSFNNISSETSRVGGVNFNKYWRGVLSMDRFGIRRTTGTNSTYAASDDALYFPNTKNVSWAKHGFTLGGVTRQSRSGEMTPYGYRANENPELTKNARCLNEGQITGYPYQISDSLEVADTHGQYYQLQMEDPGIVVWYCLAPGKSTGTRGYSMYNAMPNDASNNYYIYNKGNITYSGVGHSNLNGDMEVKLFVNTMIAAYKAGIQPPNIEILNTEAVKNSETDYSYFLNVDHASNQVIDTDKERIRFRVTDTNLINSDVGVWIALDSDPHTCLKVYKEDGVSGGLVEVTATIASKNNPGTQLVKLKSGHDYIFEYKTSNFADVTKRKVTITAENQKKLEGYANITFMERLLFNLD